MTEITVNAGELHAALALIGTAVDRSAVTQSSKAVAITCDSHGLEFSARHVLRGIYGRVTLPAEPDGMAPAPFSADYAALIAVAKRHRQTDSLTIRIDPDAMVITGPHSMHNFALANYIGHGHPIVGEKSAKVDHAFMSALKKVRTFADREEAREYLQGVHITPDHVEAATSTAVGRVSHTLGDVPSALVHVDHVPAIISVMGYIIGHYGDPAWSAWSTGWSISGPRAHFSGAVINGDFPCDQVDRYFDPGEPVLHASAQDILDTIEAASLGLAADGLLTVSQNRLTFTCANKTRDGDASRRLGESQASCEVETVREGGYRQHFSVALLERALGMLDPSASVTLREVPNMTLQMAQDDRIAVIAGWRG